MGFSIGGYVMGVGVIVQGEPANDHTDHRFFESNGDQRWAVILGVTGPIKSGWENNPLTLEPIDHFFYIGGNDGDIYKVDATDGTVVWTSTWGDQPIRSIDIDPDGNVYVCGSQSDVVGANEFGKFNSNGTKVWEGTLGKWYPPGVVGGTLQQSQGRSIACDHEGNAYIGGQWASVEGTWSFPEGEDKLAYAKISPTGQLIWMRSVPNPQALFWSNTAVTAIRIADSYRVLYMRYHNQTLFGFSSVASIDMETGYMIWSSDPTEDDEWMYIGRVDNLGNRFYHPEIRSFLKRNTSSAIEWRRDYEIGYDLGSGEWTYPIPSFVGDLVETTGFYSVYATARLSKWPYDWKEPTDRTWARIHWDPPVPSTDASSGAKIYRIAPGRIGSLIPKFAITGIAESIILSTRPFIKIIIMYHYALAPSDNLHFKLESSEEVIDTIVNRERFGYSMDGARFMKFPAEGVPAVNPYGIVVAANINIRPGTRATLTPYCQIHEGAGSDGWWAMDFTDDPPDWINLGLEEGETAEEWDTIFEHEVEGAEE